MRLKCHILLCNSKQFSVAVVDLSMLNVLFPDAHAANPNGYKKDRGRKEGKAASERCLCRSSTRGQK